VLDDGRKVTKELFRSLLAEELAKVEDLSGLRRLWKAGNYEQLRSCSAKITTDTITSSSSPCRRTS